VVDNGSVDGSISAIQGAYPHVTVCQTGANLGYAAGNNVGLRYVLQCGHQYALLLNNDTEVAPDFLRRLVDTCEADPQVGVAGPKICYYDRPDTIWSAGGIIDWPRGNTCMRGMDAPDDGRCDELVPVDFISGCALFVRCKAIVAAGMLDERFGMYFEETEWCVRIARAGWVNLYVPESRVWHKIRPAQQDRSPVVMYYMPRNRLLFLRITRAPWRVWLNALVLQDLRHWLSWLRFRTWHDHDVQRLALLEAWRDFALGRFGMVQR
jgi:GT2 family glycosyltransferase